jgi:hypothetical protein
VPSSQDDFTLRVSKCVMAFETALTKCVLNAKRCEVHCRTFHHGGDSLGQNSMCRTQLTHICSQYSPNGTLLSVEADEALYPRVPNVMYVRQMQTLCSSYWV